MANMGVAVMHLPLVALVLKLDSAHMEVCVTTTLLFLVCF